MSCSSSVPTNMRFHGNNNPGYMRHGSIRKYSIENACVPTRANSRRVCAWACQFCAGECDRHQDARAQRCAVLCRRCAGECRQVRYVGAAALSCAGHQLARAFLLENRNNNEAFYQRGHIGKVTPLDLSLAQWHTADSPAGSTAGVQGWASLSTSDVLKNPSTG